MPILGIFKLKALNENSRGFRRGGYDEKYEMPGKYEILFPDT